MNWKLLKSQVRCAWLRVLCSRPFLALHVLAGKPVIYRATMCGPFCFDGRNGSARVVGATFLSEAP